MRKTIKRLHLGRETIRRLAPQHLQGVAGAAPATNFGFTCVCYTQGLSCTCETQCNQVSCRDCVGSGNQRGC